MKQLCPRHPVLLQNVDFTTALEMYITIHTFDSIFALHIRMMKHQCVMNVIDHSLQC